MLTGDLVLFVGPGSEGGDVTLPSHRPHPPITIQGDLDFTLANGVMNGAGTAADPYQITGWTIDRQLWQGGQSTERPAIQIIGTTAHVVVKNNRINDFRESIVVRNAVNVRIEMNRVETVSAGTLHGFRVSDSSDVRVDANTILNRAALTHWEGIRIERSARVNVSVNSVENEGIVTSMYGIAVDGVTGLTAKANRVVQNATTAKSMTAYHVTDMTRSLMDANRVVKLKGQGPTTGFLLADSFANRLIGNDATSAEFMAFLSRRSEQNTWDGNRATGGTYGMVLNESRQERLERNVFTGARWGFAVHGTSREHYFHDILATNLVNGYPTVYHVGLRNTVLDGGGARVGWLGIADARNVTVRNFNLTNVGNQGILLVSFHQSILEDVTSTGNLRGIDVAHSTDCEVRRVHASTIIVTGSFQCMLKDSTFTSASGAQRWAVRLAAGTTYTTVKDSTIMGATVGVEFASGPGNVVKGVTFVGNSLAVMARANLNRVMDSNLAGNLAGATADGAVLDARNNWWGAPSGPSGRFTGSGVEVDWRLGRVDVDPWLASWP